jgi:His-Xaa-Ser system radical SAM maturase HxsC
MIPLYGRATATNLGEPLSRRVWRLTDDNGVAHRGHGHGHALLVDSSHATPGGFGLYVAHDSSGLDRAPQNAIQLPDQLRYLRAGDVISVGADGTRIRVLWRANSTQNSVLLTERCDNYCLMCSQPPKANIDTWLLEDAVELIRLLPQDTRAIGFTGGEPTLYGEGLIKLLRLCRALLPCTGVHLLSNGRRFSDDEFTIAYASVRNPQLMVGIPIYGSEPALHDYVVQARGAFDETIRGILNLVRLRQRVEIRVVLHKQTASAILEIAEFIARNLPFVEQVALMGLEMTGLARANLNEVWVDPFDYQTDLTRASILLDRHGVRTMIYNHQLCLLERAAWPFAVKSISDWKNEYHPECDQCLVRDNCGGFFHSAKYRTSDHIRAITI